LIISTDLLGLPKEFTLLQNYPNPFNPSTTIRFGLPANARVTLQVYNILGQQVVEIVNAALEAGYHELEWDGTGDRGVSVGSGVYFYKLEAVSNGGASKFHQVRKMVFMK
jgi:flagellar hook assembly protein FlgD